MNIMRLPIGSTQFARVGTYTARRLRRAKLTTLATGVEKVTEEFVVAARAEEDAEKPVQDAMADRDAADDDLDDVAQEARAQLAGRSRTASNEAPYTLIFPDGVGYYTEAPQDQEATRYGELRLRLATNLDAKDDVRVTTVAAIDAGLKAYGIAGDGLATARNAAALTTTAREMAEQRWREEMEKTYGAIVAQLGKAKAERFFPKVQSAKQKAAAKAKRDAKKKNAAAPAAPAAPKPA